MNRHSEKKVRDHVYLGGLFPAAAYFSYNLKQPKTLEIQIIFQNFKVHPIKMIGQGMEKYLTLSLGKSISFKDSLMFLSASLEQLGKNPRANWMK